jgi:hypothetical protein
MKTAAEEISARALKEVGIPSLTADRIAHKVHAFDDLIAALQEGSGPEYDPANLRELARRFADNAPIVGRDKETAAQIISDYARFIRVARAALAAAKEQA